MSQEGLTLESLATSITELTKALTQGLKDDNFPQPSFAADAPAQLPPNPAIQGPRLQLVEALMNMLHLTMGPSEYFLQLGLGLPNEAMVLDMLNHFDIWSKVPLDGSASYAEIAIATKIPESLIRRFLSVAMRMHLFREEKPGSDRIVHTAASAYPVREPVMQSFIAHCMEDTRPVSVKGVQALEKFFVGSSEASEELSHSPFEIAYPGRSVWDLLSQDEPPGKPKGYRATRFAEAMQAIAKSSSVGTEVAVNAFDWDKLGESTVVDVGGSSGHVSVMLANTHPKLKFIVQDLPNAEKSFNELISKTNLASRISFRAHDFFKPQTESADAYLVKSVFHDWPDKYVVQILQNITPVLKPGNHVLVFDLVVPPDYDENGKPTVPLSIRRFLGLVDMQMFVAFNSKERKVEDWVAVFKRADGRLNLDGVYITPGAPLAVLDFVFGADR